MGKGNWKCKVSVSTSDNTDTSMKIKASCVWDSNDWSYDMNGITGWVYINGKEYKVYSGSIDCSSGNTKTLGSKTVTINKTHSSQPIPCYAKIKSTSSYSSGTETSGTTNKTVSAKTSYTVSYNANGGSGAPGNQTKWYSEDLNLSSTIPTRPGYTFNGWNTNSSGTGTNYSSGAKYTSNAALTLYAKWTINTYTVSYNANGGSSTPGNQTKNYGSTIKIAGAISRTGYTFNGWSGSDGVYYSAGASFSGNYNLTLTARWTINTYTISYNANGGSGAPGNQTKTYGQNLILSSTIPTKNSYNFKGWATSQNGAVAYQPGSTYTNNSGATLWAVWELAYVKPRINNFQAYRCNSEGVADESGTYIKVEADWETDKPIGQSVSGSGLKIYWGTSESYSTVNIIYNLPTTHDSINKIIGGGNVSPETSYYVQIYVNDVTGYNETAKYPIPAVSYPIDIKKYGKGIAFGGVASEENVMDVNFKARYWKGQKMWETINSGNNKRWQYLGQVQINRQGDYAHFKIFGGAGQNAATNQNMLMDIVMKKGFQSESSTTNYVGVTYNIYKMNDDRYNTDNVKVKVLCRTVGYAEVYIYFDWPWSTIRYTIDGVFDNFIRGSGNDLTELPTDGVEQPCIGGVVPILYNGDLTTIRSFRIPKNPDEGAGLCNSDGLSIIRDHNNGCVTVDATNSVLFLGWAHTTGLNILNGKAFVESGGKFVSKNGDAAFSHTHSTSGKTITFGVGSGGENRGIWDNNYNNWIFGHNNAKTTWINGDFIQLNNNTRVYGYLDVNNNIRTYNGNIWADTGSIWVNTGSIRCNTVDGSGKGCRMNSNGNLTVCGSVYNDYGSMRFKHIYDADIQSNAPNMYIQSNGWIRRTSNTSLLAHKKDIKNVENEELNPEKLYNLEVKQFKYKDDYQPSEYDIRYGKDLIGFIAEDVEKFYPIAADYEYDVDHDEDENINDYKKDTVETVKRSLINWNERYLIPPMLKLIQNHKKEIDDLKVKMAALEQRLAALENNN